MSKKPNQDLWEILLKQKMERHRKERIAWAVVITIWLLALAAFLLIGWKF